MLIKNATIITDKQTSRSDLLIEGEKIARIGPDLKAEGHEVLDASGKYLLPGGVDPHVHLDLPMFDTVSSDDHYTGTKAAAFGGTTTVIDFVSFDYPTLRESVEVWKARAGKAVVDYSAHMNMTKMSAAIAIEIPSLPGMGITSFKTFTAYNNRLRLSDGDIFRAMRIARDAGILVLLHAENGDVIETLVAEALAQGHTTPEWHARTRPGWGAVEATLRACSLAAQADARLYIVHMNMAGEVDMLKYARQHNVKVMGETCPQYLFFTEDDLRRPDGAKWVCSPPVRSKADNARLWEGVEDGTIQTMATDHCPFFYDGTKSIVYEGQPVAIPGKELGKNDFTRIPNGLPGVGDRLPVLWTTGVGSGKISPQQFVALTSTNPAKIFGIYPQKGALLPGSDADIVVWDPKRNVKFGVAHSAQRTDYNLYEDWELTGFPEKVYLRGKLIVDREQWLGEKGMGRFLMRKSGELI